MFELDHLRRTAPFGLNLVEGILFYSGENPEDYRLRNILVSSKKEVLSRYREEFNDPAFAVAVRYGGRKDTNYFVYRVNENDLEDIYIILNKIYTGWYKWDTLLGLEKILDDDSQEFKFDSEQFEAFKKTLSNMSALEYHRKDKLLSTGEKLAFAYIDFLAENYENEILQDRGMSRIRPRNLYRKVIKQKK